MKKVMLFFFLIVIVNSLYGQNSLRITNMDAKDSLELLNFFKPFKNRFDAKDFNGVKSLSLKKVECNLSLINTNHDTEIGINYIPINTFLINAFKNLSYSKYCRVQILEVKHQHPENLKIKKGQLLRIYQVWYNYPSLNHSQEIAQGKYYAFEFVKVNGVYKFFGLTSTI